MEPPFRTSVYYKYVRFQFRGIIKDKNTITDWQLVSPELPEKIKINDNEYNIRHSRTMQLDMNALIYEKTPKTLHSDK